MKDKIKSVFFGMLGILLGFKNVAAGTFFEGNNPTLNVDIVFVVFAISVLLLMAVFYYYKDRRRTIAVGWHILSAIGIAILATYLVLFVILAACGNPSPNTFDVTDTDVAGDATANVSISSIEIDGYYENEHFIGFVYPEYQEDLTLVFDASDVNGNKTATIEIMALDSEGNIKERHSKTADLVDYKQNRVSFKGLGQTSKFGTMHPAYAINITYNGSSDVDQISLSRNTNTATFTSAYTM